VESSRGQGQPNRTDTGNDGREDKSRRQQGRMGWYLPGVKSVEEQGLEDLSGCIMARARLGLRSKASCVYVILCI